MAMNDQPVEELKVSITTPGIVKATNRLTKLAEAAQKVQGSLGGLAGGTGGSGGKGGSSKGGKKSALDEGTTQITKWQALTAKISAHFDAMKKDGKSLGSLFKNSKMSQFFSSLKRIALYRIIRSIISTATNWAKEGLTNVYDYSKKNGTSFAPAMDRLASTVQQLKNTLGTTLAQFLVAAEPLLNNILKGLVNITNALNKLFAMLSGESEYVKAVAVTKEWREENEKLKKSLLGIDELNIIGNQTANVDDMFVMEKLATKSGEVQTNIANIATSLTAIVAALGSIKLVEIGSKLGVIESSLSGIGGALGTCFGWISSIWGILTAIINASEFTESIGDVMSNWNAWLDGWIGKLGIVGGMIRGISEFFVGNASMITQVMSFLHDLFSDWSVETGVLEHLAQWCKDFLRIIGNFFVDLLNGIISPINGFIDGMNSVFGTNWDHIAIPRFEYSAETQAKNTLVSNGGYTNEFRKWWLSDESASAKENLPIEITLMIDNDVIARAVTTAQASQSRRVGMLQ